MSSRKNHYGGGSIYQEKGGRWVGDARINGQRRRVIASTAKDARAKLDKLRQAAADGLPVPDGTLTVSQWLDHWRTEVLPGRVGSPNTVTNYSHHITRHIIPAIGSRRLRDLSPEDVERMLKAMAAEGLSRSTVNRTRAVLVMALRHAEKRGRIARNVAQLADMPSCEPTEARKALTAEQAAKLLEAAHGDRLEALYVTGLMLGLRPGELTGLRWTDVDLEGGILHIRGMLKREPRAEGKGHVLRLGEPKTSRSRRSLDLPAPVVDALRRHRPRQVAEQLAAGPLWSAEWGPIGLVFTTEVGTPIDPANLRRSFKALTESAGLGRWTPYELRHSAASLLSAAGVHAEVVGDVLGHDGTRMVATVYRHAVTPTVAAAVAPMEAMFAASGE